MYLNQYLQKAMLLAIEGFYPMNEKYLHTWELLKERYGNLQTIITKLIKDAILLNFVHEADVTEVRDIFDHIKINIRSLKQLAFIKNILTHY